MTPEQQLNDVEAEKGLIGAVLIQPGAVSDLDIRTGDFYQENHRFIWAAITDITRDGSQPDIVTVTSRLGIEKLQKIGGQSYLLKLTANCPNSTNYREYAAQVKKVAWKRDALDKAGKIANLAANPDTAAETIAKIFRDKATEFEEVISQVSGAARDPWTPYFIADALQDRPPVEYIANGLFALPSLNVVYGAPGCMKSLVLADLAIAVAAGVNWLPPAPWQSGAAGFATKQCPVMWIDFDNGDRQTHERIAALARARGLSSDVPFYYYSMPMPWLDANNIDSTGMLAIRARGLGIKLIIIDNLGTISGGVDENSGAMIKVMSNLRMLAQETGAAVIVIHHQRKSNGFTGRAGDSLRGHSSIEAALNLALLVEREPDSDTIAIKSTKTRGVDVLPFSAVLTFTHRDNTTDLETAMFYGLAAEDNTSAKAIEREILATLGDQELNQAELVKATKERLEVGERRIRDMVRRLVKNKKIDEHTGLHNAKIYTIHH